MPLVKSTDDDAFVREVRRKMEEHCRQKVEHTSAMIEEYLRLRDKEFEEKMRHEVACQEEKAQHEKDAQKQTMAKVSGQLSTAKTQIARATNVISALNNLTVQQRCFHRWLRFRTHKRQIRERGAQYSLLLSRLAAFHCFSQWRLFVAGRQEHREQVRQKKQWKSREKELTEQVNELMGKLDAEKHRNEELDEKLKDAFVRGVSALNREAFQALRGDQSDKDVAAIEEILSGSLTRRDPAAASLRSAEACREEARHSVDVLSGVCPVHMVDKEKNFYHRCYAPSTCRHGPHKPASPPASHTPFFVHLESTGVPSYNAGPPIKIQAAKTMRRR